MTRALTDRSALVRNRERAEQNPALFLHEFAADEIKDRLSIVNKRFTSPVIVSGQPGVWSHLLESAKHIDDSDTLDVATNSHDFALHAMALHWANDPVGQLIQMRRALKPDGLFIGVFFGGQSLHELRSALAQAETDLRGGLSARVAPMGDIRDLGALLQRAKFALPVADVVTLTVKYQSPLHLMRDLRAMGETNALMARPRGFSRKDVISRASEIYIESYGEPEGRIRATFELIVLTGWAADPGQPQPLRPGSAKKRLSDALGAQEISLKD